MYSIKWFSNVPYTCKMSKKQECLKKCTICYKNCFDMYVYNNVLKTVFHLVPLPLPPFG